MSNLDWSLQQATKTTAQIAAATNIFPLVGQIVWNTDTGKYCIGDGTTALSALTFYGGISASGLTVGSTTITGGTSTRVLYNNAGVVGEYAVTGSGSVVLNTSPTFVTDITTPLIIGGTGSGGNMTLQSTTNATKGKILFGTSGYDEVNNRLGIATSSPSHLLHVSTTTVNTGALIGNLFLGVWSSANTYAEIRHTTSAQYAFIQSSTGLTYFNGATQVNFACDGVLLATITNRKFTFNPQAVTSGAQQLFVITNANNTNQTASAEISGTDWTTFTRTWNTGAIGTQREIRMRAPTYAFNAASTITNAYNLYCESPIAGTNATITNSYSFGTAGKAKFGGNIELTQTVTTEALVSDTSVTIVINGVTYKLLAKA